MDTSSNIPASEVRKLLNQLKIARANEKELEKELNARNEELEDTKMQLEKIKSENENMSRFSKALKCKFIDLYWEHFLKFTT